MTTQAPAAEGQAVAAPEAQGQATQQPTTNNPVWYDKAPDEVKGYIQNKGWDDPIKAVNSYQELEKFRGASEKELLRLPKDPNAEGAFDEIYNRLGRPEAPDKYALDLGQDVQIDDVRLNSFREIAHKAGITQKQFEALAKADAEFMTAATKEYETARVQKMEGEYQALIKEWGANASEREELARRGLLAILPQGGDKKELAAAIESAIGTAMTLKLFANVGDKIAREDRIPDSAGDRPFGYTREQALADKKALMSELKADNERLANYNKGIGPDYDKMQRILKITA